MNFEFATPCRAILAACALAAACVGAGCSGNSPGQFLASTGLGPKMAPTPDFVANSRPKDLDYIPIGTPQQGRPTAVRTPDEVKATEAELDAVRNQNQTKGEAAAKLGGTPAPQTVATPAKKSSTP